MHKILVISLDECQKFPYDYLVIASSYTDEIENTNKNKKIFDLQKVVRKNKFYPQNNELKYMSNKIKFFIK